MLSYVSRRISPLLLLPMFHRFVSPLEVLHGVVVVTIQVSLCELLCLGGLLYVISGILAGGIRGFRIVLCCFAHIKVWQVDDGGCVGSSLAAVLCFCHANT